MSIPAGLLTWGRGAESVSGADRHLTAMRSGGRPQERVVFGGRKGTPNGDPVHRGFLGRQRRFGFVKCPQPRTALHRRAKAVSYPCGGAEARDGRSHPSPRPPTPAPTEPTSNSGAPPPLP